MPTTVTISGAQRQVFYEMVTDHLGAIGDLRIAIQQEDFATAERLGIEFGEDLRLMEDLGWDKEWREDVDLTMAPEDLAEILTRIKSDAEGGLSESKDHRESREAEEEARRCYQLTLDTCNGLLMLLDRLGDSQ